MVFCFPNYTDTRIICKKSDQNKLLYEAQYLKRIWKFPFVKHWVKIPLDDQLIISTAASIYHYTYAGTANIGSAHDQNFARSVVSAYWRLLVNSPKHGPKVTRRMDKLK